MIRPSPRRYTHILASPIGRLQLVVDAAGAVVRIGFVSTEQAPLEAGLESNKYACGQAAFELDEYFKGKRTRFDCQLKPEGSEFRQLVWSILAKTRYGEILTYSELAALCGKPKAIRAVANAVACNPIPIMIPCHRILPKSGGTGNYALHSLPAPEGQRIKKLLLDLEQGQA